jgi:hypothetical protein
VKLDTEFLGQKQYLTRKRRFSPANWKNLRNKILVKCSMCSIALCTSGSYQKNLGSFEMWCEEG